MTDALRPTSPSSISSPSISISIHTTLHYTTPLRQLVGTPYSECPPSRRRWAVCVIGSAGDESWAADLHAADMPTARVVLGSSPRPRRHRRLAADPRMRHARAPMSACRHRRAWCMCKQACCGRRPHSPTFPPRFRPLSHRCPIPPQHFPSLRLLAALAPLAPAPHPAARAANHRRARLLPPTLRRPCSAPRGCGMSAPRLVYWCVCLGAFFSVCSPSCRPGS